MLKQSALLLSTAALLATSSNVIFENSAEAKGKARARARSGHAYLVPPPPAYAPSILPTSARGGYGYQAHPSGTSNRLVVEEDGAQAQTETPDTSSKYIYTRGGNDPKAVRPNKYVTYWNKS